MARNEARLSVLGSGLRPGEGLRPRAQLGADRAPSLPSPLRSPLSRRGPGAAADAAVSALTPGHHSDGGGCQRTLGAKPRLKGQESDTGQFVPKYRLGRRQSGLQINIKREKMQIRVLERLNKLY